MWKTSSLLAAALAAAVSLPVAPDVNASISLSASASKAFDLEITWEPYEPLGIPRKMLLVNGQTPGPELRFDQDDQVTVHVVNNSPFNTTVHFHGLEMHGTPWSDGVPGVTQRPIGPGCAFTYRFTATQHGSYWYHSHSRDQIEDGLYGAIFIRPRPDTPNPFHLIPGADVRAMELAAWDAPTTALSDLMHITSEEKWDITLASGIEITCYDRILFNGKGRTQCLTAADMLANLTPPQKGDLALVPGSSLTDRGCFPPNIMAAFGGDLERFNESAIPRSVFYGCRNGTEPVETLHATAGRWVAFNVLGSTNFVTGAFSVDEHEMWVYAVDGSYVVPQRVHAIPLSNGERYSVLLRPTRAGAFKVRFNAMSAPQMVDGYAVLSVREPGTAKRHPSADCPDSAPWVSISGGPLSPDVIFYSDDRAHPFPAEPIPATADALHILNMKPAGTSYLWALNRTPLQPSDLDIHTSPLLFQRPDDHFTNNNVTLTTRNGTWVDLVLYASVFPMPPHPVHKHGNKMYRIGAGTGAFRWSSVDEAVKEVPGQFNLVNPPRRDTFVTQVARKETSWIVVRYQVVNPGAWLLHCHISNHMMGGMMVVLLDGVDAWPTVPEEYLDYH